MNAKIIAVCISDAKGKGKTEIPVAKLQINHGIENDVHAGKWHRQVSLLATEKIAEMQAKGVEVNIGDFGENIITEGIELEKLIIGTKLKVGTDVILQVTQIGKECHTPCAIFYNVGYCIMPESGVFTKVLNPGEIKKDDKIEIIETPKTFDVGIVVVSDSASKGERISTTEAIIEKLIAQNGGIVKVTQIVPDEIDHISNVLNEMSDVKKLELVITTGGTGLSPRDNTPEATIQSIDKEIPGFSEAMRMESFKITKRAILSRGVTGFRGKTLIINLPGSPKGVEECLNIVREAIPHALELLKGNVNNCADD
ncbi:MAG: MOSC domain-containing protein [Planctomycetes bacterium]|nr:MOSC domain-containing protein [Planctomycetota bacterium]